MYVCTPLNKVFGFQGSKILVVNQICFPIPFLVEPFLKPFLKPSRPFELEAVNSKLQILPEKFWSAKKSTRLKWSIFLLNPFKKCQSRKGGSPEDTWHQNNNDNRAKGVALKSPDIKIIMYVCTPLNKVFGFQGSKILVVALNLFLNSFPSWTLSQTLSEALKTLWAGSSKLQTPNLAWKVLECKKNQQGSNGRFPY